MLNVLCHLLMSVCAGWMCGPYGLIPQGFDQRGHEAASASHDGGSPEHTCQWPEDCCAQQQLSTAQRGILLATRPENVQCGELKTQKLRIKTDKNRTGFLWCSSLSLINSHHFLFFFSVSFAPSVCCYSLLGLVAGGSL